MTNPTTTTDSQAVKHLRDYRLLSFDVYGTLIDWESGIYTALLPLIDRSSSGHSLAERANVLQIFTNHERNIQATNPWMLYPEVLRRACKAVALDLDIECEPQEADEDEEFRGGGESWEAFAESFGASVGQWKAFGDTVEAMKKLGARYKLVALSNVDRTSLEATLRGPLEGIRFDAVYTAEEIGSYKPSLSNFEYLLEHVEKDFGVKKEEVLHVAQSLVHDHVPAKTMGLESVWIERGGEKSSMGGNEEELREQINYRWRFKDLAELAQAAEKDFAVIPPSSEDIPASPYEKALHLIDEAHAQDPTTISINGHETPYELHYARKMTSYLDKLYPDAPPTLRLAIRAQHFRRWEVPRSSYPMTKPGYYAWRTGLKTRQATQASQICLSAGFSAVDADRIAALIRKEDLKQDDETQVLEDVACLVFLDDQFEEFERLHDEEKILGILRKTWRKMGENGRREVGNIEMSERARGLVEKALNG
ncbi:MAG: hypothetical protein M1817_006873 [Caeruleum heppii]|nr:MAG: hypothetical protein M1817_006873 [Caeruleum heppii]